MSYYIIWFRNLVVHQSHPQQATGLPKQMPATNLGDTRAEKVSNIELWHRTGQQPIAKMIRERKLRWTGHTLQQDQTNIARHALDFYPQGHRPVMTKKKTPLKTEKHEED